MPEATSLLVVAYVAYTKQEGLTEADQWADTGWHVPRPTDLLPTADTEVSETAAWRAVSAGVAAYRRYAESGDAAQLDAAVDAFTRAVAFCPGDAPHFSHLNNLANALVDRFELRWEAEREEREAERELIRRKVGDAAQRAAAPIELLELFYGNQPHFAKLNKRLEAEHAERAAKRELAKREEHEAKRELADWEARWAGRASDLDDALRYAHWALWTRSGDSPDAARALATLRRVQRQREASEVLPKRGPQLEYVNERLAAMTCAPVADRVAALQHVSGSRPSFETSLEAIVETLPRTLAWIGPRGQVREPAQPTADMLDMLIGLALYKSDTTLAVELFEAGRGVLWDRLIGHSAQSVTRAKAPALARRLERAARGLDEHGGLPGLAHMAAPQRSDRKERRADARLKRRRARQQRVWDGASRKVPRVERPARPPHAPGAAGAPFLG
ncbi:hypothetical protein ACFXDI_42065, partial [Streptomyces mirabilis]|uniref:hypothetical protein n=1 Tax=Streptomyces mirabilis TaxID=68239 RepID=UPI00368D2AF7